MNFFTLGGEEKDKERYYKEIIKTIIDLNSADEFIVAISNLIKRMAIDHLHIIGDIFDRGRHPVHQTNRPEIPVEDKETPVPHRA